MRVKLLAAVAGAALVGSLAGGAAVFAATQTFSDVPPSHPFHSQIEWAAQQGIVTGYADGSFKPGSTVTRQAAAAFLSRYNDAIEIRHATGEVPNLGTATFTTVVCPAGKRAVGGGGYALSQLVVLQDSFPATSTGALNDGGNADRWVVGWVTNSGSGIPAVPVHAYAICAPMPA